MHVYLDNAATTPMDPEVIAAMTDAMKNVYGNPSSVHARGREAKTLLERARKTVAKLVNASPGEVFFTSGGTEANNTVLRRAWHDLDVRRFISAATEHHAVLHTLEELGARQDTKLELLRLDAQGRIGLDELGQSLKRKEGPVLVSLMYANNETGTLHPVKDIAALCRANGAFFHSDTVQSVGHYPIDLQAWPVDFISASAHKFHGPKGAGFLYIDPRVKIRPFITGGSQERNMRGGTENLYGAVGLAKALEIACAGMEADRRHIENLRQRLTDRLRAEIPGIAFHGAPGDESLYTVLNVSFPPCDFAEMFLFNLDIQGIAASGGSACSSGSEAGSHVLKALGADPGRPAVRFSFSKYNTVEEVDFVVEALKEMYGERVGKNVQGSKFKV
jgi:cysteine desulfurase